MAKEAIQSHDAIISLACRTFTISETGYRYQPKLNSDNELIADLLFGLVQNQRNWGFGYCDALIFTSYHRCSIKKWTMPIKN